MFGNQRRKVKPKRVPVAEEMFDMCGYPLPAGYSSKPVGPDRKVFFHVNRRSTTVPLKSSTPGGGQQGKQLGQLGASKEGGEGNDDAEAEKVKKMKKHFRQGLTKGWYDSSKGDSGLGPSKGPGVADFQKSQQMTREENLLPGHRAQTILDNFPIGGRAVRARSNSTRQNINSDDQQANSNDIRPPAKKPAFLSSTIFGTMHVESQDSLQRKKEIQQQNIMSTRRLRAGIPEPIEGLTEGQQGAFEKEALRIQIQQDEKKEVILSHKKEQEAAGPRSLMPVPTAAGTISVLAARPFERQLHNRKLRDAIMMEKELEKVTANLSAEHVRKFVPAYRMRNETPAQGLEATF